MAAGGGVTAHICLHGAESTGKTVLAEKLAARLGGVVVPEFGRAYCEEYGIDIGRDDLLAIMRGHVAATDAAQVGKPKWLISDTDPLMTQAWALMLLGERLPEIDAWEGVADFYLVPALDLPWQEDGTRLFGSASARQQFMNVAIGELDRRGLRWTWVEGDGDERVARALEALQAAGFAV